MTWHHERGGEKTKKEYIVLLVTVACVVVTRDACLGYYISGCDAGDGYATYSGDATAEVNEESPWSAYMIETSGELTSGTGWGKHGGWNAWYTDEEELDGGTRVDFDWEIDYDEYDTSSSASYSWEFRVYEFRPAKVQVVYKSGSYTTDSAGDKSTWSTYSFGDEPYEFYFKGEVYYDQTYVETALFQEVPFNGQHYLEISGI